MDTHTATDYRPPGDGVAAGEGPWLDMAGAAAYLRVTPRWIRQRVADRTVRFYRVGRFVRFRKEDLDALATPVDASLDRS